MDNQILQGSEYKVVLVGDGGVGKTTLIKRLRIGEFEKRYVATLGVEVHRLKFRTTYGEVSINFWDTAGQDKFGGLRDGYYMRADGVIAMCDDNARTVENMDHWVSEVIGSLKRPDIPVVKVQSKIDVTKYQSRETDFAISSKNCFGIYKPIEKLIRDISGLDDVELLE